MRVGGIEGARRLTTPYFAFGSNLDPDELKRCCPHAVFDCVAMLADHHLVFPRRSTVRRCGVASVVPQPGVVVWGVVYLLQQDGFGALDEKEGFLSTRPARENPYNRIPITVLREGAPTASMTAETYVATPVPNAPLPSREYMAMIIGGARHWGLPVGYIAQLELIPTAT